MSTTENGFIEVINTAISPVFSNTAENDIALYTGGSNQAIHIGAPSTGATTPSTIKVTKSNVAINYTPSAFPSATIDQVTPLMVQGSSNISAQFISLKNEWGTSVLRKVSIGQSNYRNYIQSEGGSATEWTTLSLLLNPAGGAVAIGVNTPAANTRLHVGSNVKVDGVVTATSFTGDGAALTSLNATNISTGTVPTARLPTATTTVSGVVQLTDSTSTTSSTLAATATAVKAANDNANTRALSSHTHDGDAITTGTVAAARLPPASTTASGIVQLTNSTASTSTDTAATPNAVKTTFDLAAAASNTANQRVLKSGDTMTGTLTVPSLTVNGPSTVGGHVLPSATLTYDLGSSNARFRDLYISGSTIDMGGTRITSDTSNNIKITDSNNALRRIIVEEIQIGETSGGALRLKKDAVGGGFKFFDVASSGIEVTSSNISSSGSSGGVSLSNIAQSITSSTPANGYTAGTVSVPIVNMKTVPADANISYGQVEFTSHSGVSLANNASMSVVVTHNLGSTSYIVYATPELGSSVQVNITNKTANTFTMTIKNVSGASIADPVVNYQLIKATLSSQSKVIASPVTIVTSSSNIQAYSGASSTSKTVSIPSNLVTDPQAYPITYTLSNDTTGRAALSGSTLTYTHLKSNATGTVVVRAQNPYNNDATKTITFNVTETRLNQPLNTDVATVSTTQSSTGSGQAGSSNLPSTDQGLALTYTLGTNGLGASISGNTVNWTSAGASGTRSAVLNASFAAAIMAEAALGAKAFTLSVAETFRVTISYIMNSKTRTSPSVHMSASCGSSHTIVIKSNGIVLAWGANTWGQLGNNGSTNNLTPLNISAYGSLNGTSFTTIACGANNTYIVDTSGKLHSWGLDNWGQTGSGSYNLYPRTPSLTTAGSLNGKTVIAIACGSEFAVALDSTGKVHTWGNSNTGQLGNNGGWNPTPSEISSIGSLSGKVITAIACGSDHTIALDSSGQLHAWGANSFGQLGDTTNTQRSSAVAISTFGSINGKTIKSISCGSQHTVVVDTTGKVHAWGVDNWGQVGAGAYNQYPTSAQAIYGSLSDKTTVAVACGGEHSVALDSLGNVHTWGNGSSGQLGDGTTGWNISPVSRSTSGSLNGATIVSIACGSTHVIALDNAGNIHLWGGGGSGQLGTNATDNTTVPFQLAL